MSDIIFSGFIAGGTAVFTLLINQIFQHLRDKSARKERFFNDQFPVRLQAHNQILADVSDLRIHEAALHFESAQTLAVFLEDTSRKLLVTLTKNLLVTDPAVAICVAGLIRFSQETCTLVQEAEEVDHPDGIFHRYQVGYSELYNQLLEMLLEKSGSKAVTKAVHELLGLRKKNGKKQR